jgi:hypothetical protein
MPKNHAGVRKLKNRHIPHSPKLHSISFHNGVHISKVAAFLGRSDLWTWLFKLTPDLLPGCYVTGQPPAPSPTLCLLVILEMGSSCTLTERHALTYSKFMYEYTFLYCTVQYIHTCDILVHNIICFLLQVVREKAFQTSSLCSLLTQTCLCL